MSTISMEMERRLMLKMILRIIFNFEEAIQVHKLDSLIHSHLRAEMMGKIMFWRLRDVLSTTQAWMVT